MTPRLRELAEMHHGDALQRSQEDIRQRRQMAAAYYVLRDLQSVRPWVVYWSELSWAEQERGG